MKSFQFSIAFLLSLLLIGFAYNPIACQSPTTAPASQPTEKANNDVDKNGIGLLKRAIEKRVFPKKIDQLNGHICFNICINRAGNIIYAKHNKDGSTITNRDVVADALSAMKRTKFEANIRAPYAKECGQWTMNFKSEQ